MENTSETHFVFKVLSRPLSKPVENLIWQYAANSGQKYSNNPTVVTYLHQAQKFDCKDLTKIIETYQYLLTRFGEGNVEFVEVIVETKISKIDLGKDDFLEERRRIALLKLSNDDIKALGLERIATYNKLRYHNPPDNELTIDFSILSV